MKLMNLKNNIALYLLILLVSTSFLSGCTTPSQLISSFTFEPSLPQRNETVFLNSTSTSEGSQITDYAWYINDTLVGNEKNIVYSFQTNGTYTISLKVTNSEGISNRTNQSLFVGANTKVKQKLIGLWQWEGNSQIGNWTFYQNNTLKSVFTGVLPTGEYGSSSVVYWKYAVDDTTLYFFDPSVQYYDSADYTYQLLNEDTLLRVQFGNSTAEWEKISP